MPSATKSATISSDSKQTARTASKKTLRNYPGAGYIALACAMTTAATVVSTPLSAQDLLAREVLVQMSRSQSTMLCGLKPFTECMAFTEKECLALSEQAVKQCLMPLPEKIKLSELENDSIESCPKKVYEDAGYSDEKAKACLQEAAKK